MAEAKTIKATQEVPAEPQHTKDQFLGSVKYAASVDVLNALLDSEKLYTASEVDELLRDFYGKEVRD
ncbi:hypothetical protein ACFSVM_25630 [Paenibacillus shunpengii]|uniref:Uncharacterized protein n=1 Tax=Paenibacillus shunpengii TaxID=2054424 RepID=A0ABW5SWJ1_9BACL